MATSKPDTQRIQISLDSWNAELIAAMEHKRHYGENKKEIANNIIREWFRNYLKDEGISDENLKASGKSK